VAFWRVALRSNNHSSITRVIIGAALAVRFDLDISTSSLRLTRGGSEP
jgi:hypothetical protein